MLIDRWRLNLLLTHDNGMFLDEIIDETKSVYADLREATKEVYKEQEHLKLKQKINRLLEKLDKKSQNRDSLIHSPFALLIECGDLKVIPNDMANNRLAKRLAGEPDVRSTLKQIYGEFSDLNRLALELFEDLPRTGIK